MYIYSLMMSQAQHLTKSNVAPLWLIWICIDLLCFSQEQLYNDVSAQHLTKVKCCDHDSSVYSSVYFVSLRNSSKCGSCASYNTCMRGKLVNPHVAPLSVICVQYGGHLCLFTCCAPQLSVRIYTTLRPFSFHQFYTHIDTHDEKTSTAIFKTLDLEFF